MKSGHVCAAEATASRQLQTRTVSLRNCCFVSSCASCSTCSIRLHAAALVQAMVEMSGRVTVCSWETQQAALGQRLHSALSTGGSWVGLCFIMMAYLIMNFIQPDEDGLCLLA